MHCRLLLVASLLLTGLPLYAQPRATWPSQRDVRRSEAGCWSPPGDRFSRAEALAAVQAPFAAGLAEAERSFGVIPADLQFDGFVPVRLSAQRAAGDHTAHLPCEVSVVQLGPRREKAGEIMDHVIKATLLLTSRGVTLWQEELGDTAAGSSASHYRLARVVTRFEQAPFVLLFSDAGANTRNFSYDLYRVTLAGLEKVWSDDLRDGHTGSTQQGYSWTNFDFSRLRSGKANEFTTYTTSGIRRVFEAGDEKRLQPKHTKRVYRWDARRGTFTQAVERK